MTDEAPRPNSPERKRRVVYLVLGALFGLPALMLLGGYAFWYRQCKAELDAEIERVLDRGEPLWFEDLDPGPDENLYLNGDLVAAALKVLPKPPRQFREFVDANPPPGEYPQFRVALAASRAQLDRVVEAARGSNCRFRYDYRTTVPFNILLSHVQQTGRGPTLLKADVLQSLGTGDDARAVQAVIDALDVAELLRDEPFLVSQLVRASAAGKGLDGLAITLASVDLDDGQFPTIDRRLAEMEERFRLASVIQNDRAMQFTTMNHLEKNPEEFSAANRTVFGRRVPEWRHRWYGSFFYRPPMMRQQAFMLRTMSRLAACVDQPGPAGKRKLDRIENDLDVQLESQPVNAALLAEKHGGFRFTDSRGAGLQHRQRLIAARLGLRVSRYRAEHGRLPDSLDEVLDEHIDAMPVGLFSGKPFVYEPGPDGFSIYDVDPETEAPAGRFEVSAPRAPEPQRSAEK